MKLCVALDLPNLADNISLARDISGMDLWVKIGMREFYSSGVSGIKEFKKLGFKIFLDLKLYDIPNTMANAACVLADIGVDMINVHASAGSKAMSAVMDRLNKLNNRPLVLAVSALTSFDDSEFEKIYNASINSAVKDMSLQAYKAGLDGMVCSVFESKMIKELTTENFITLTPGIRPFGENSNDQSRVANLSIAKEQKSDFIVVGRPIIESKNPKEMVNAILEKINI